MTYFDKLNNWFKDNKLFAWIIIITSVVLGISALISGIRSILEDIHSLNKYPYELVIYLTPVDQGRWEHDDKEFTSWGGGTQTIYVETYNPFYYFKKENDPTDFKKLYDLYPYSLNLDSLTNIGIVKNIWEVIRPPYGAYDADQNGLTFRMNAVFNSEKKNTTCILKEWGITVSDSDVPANGFYAYYRIVGGAYVPPTGGMVIIDGNGTYAIKDWIIEGDGEESNKFASDNLAEYLQIGETVFKDISLLCSEQMGSHKLKHNPMPVYAKIIDAYAICVINGKEFKFTSKNCIKTVIFSGFNDWQVFEYDEIHAQRNKAYFERK